MRFEGVEARQVVDVVQGLLGQGQALADILPTRVGVGAAHGETHVAEKRAELVTLHTNGAGHVVGRFADGGQRTQPGVVQGSYADEDLRAQPLVGVTRVGPVGGAVVGRNVVTTRLEPTGEILNSAREAVDHFSDVVGSETLVDDDIGGLVRLRRPEKITPAALVVAVGVVVALQDAVDGFKLHELGLLEELLDDGLHLFHKCELSRFRRVPVEQVVDGSAE
ncbi:restriction endonuclease subunit S [Babesia caballi]|uniref:Restriction endonuclease subunit S n=1 Tax=Babesia caballi TaxID=5871 RepID=A0AAV4M2J6_BABCB|nr:restriction endonuclease subunit S [Babesia caballi]